MDLGTVYKRVTSGYYADVVGVRNDLKTIWENCHRYNGVNHAVGMAATELSQLFEKALASGECTEASQRIMTRLSVDPMSRTQSGQTTNKYCPRNYEEGYLQQLEEGLKVYVSVDSGVRPLECVAVCLLSASPLKSCAPNRLHPHLFLREGTHFLHRLSAAPLAGVVNFSFISQLSPQHFAPAQPCLSMTIPSDCSFSDCSTGCRGTEGLGHACEVSLLLITTLCLRLWLAANVAADSSKPSRNRLQVG